MPEKHIGKVVQITGPVLDIRFKDGELPAWSGVSTPSTPAAPSTYR